MLHAGNITLFNLHPMPTAPKRLGAITLENSNKGSEKYMQKKYNV